MEEDEELRDAGAAGTEVDKVREGEEEVGEGVCGAVTPSASTQSKTRDVGQRDVAIVGGTRTFAALVGM